MDALTFVKRWTSGRWKTTSFVLVFLFPILGNVISRISKHGKWLNDFDALICGAHSIGQGLSPYSLHPTCTGLHPAPFVYAPQIGLALFLSLIGISGLVLAEWSGLDSNERIVLGLGIAQLLNPRLMDYDMLALAPAMALIVMRARPLGQTVFRRVSWAFTGVLIFSVVINVLEIPGIHRAPISVFVFCLITLYVAALTAWPHRMRIRGWLRAPLPTFRDIWRQNV